jgi:CheY-like chemotaxis protein
MLRQRERIMDNDIFKTQQTQVVGIQEAESIPTPDVSDSDIEIEELDEEKVKTKTILSIDDNKAIIELYDRFLKNHGYEVIALTNPKEAVEKVEEIQPYAITLDLMMPEMNGWEVLHQLKHNEKTKNIPIIICSIQEEEEKGISLGAADYLVKPFLDTDMVDTLNRLNHAGNMQKILIIEDDQNEDEMVSKMLEGTEQFDITAVHTGREGWNIILDDQPDLLILDLFLPDLSGFAILERIRSDESLFKIPIILVSSSDLTADQYAQLREFNNMLISKSFLSEKTLLHKLEETLSQVE